MKRLLSVGLLVSFVICLLGFSRNAIAIDVNALFTQLKVELQKKGMAPADINENEQSIKNLLDLGASQFDVKNILLDFVANGFKGRDIGSLVSMVSDLMKDGSSMKVARDIIFQAIKQANITGLKGNTLVAKIQEFVDQKKAQLSQVKSKGEDLKKSLGPIFGK